MRRLNATSWADLDGAFERNVFLHDNLVFMMMMLTSQLGLLLIQLIDETGPNVNLEGRETVARPNG